jgi:CRISPR/Cas system type I-B associated protein Csh2 (Cas7 group RAMP superfamily)
MLEMILSGLKGQIGEELVSKAGVSQSQLGPVLDIIGQTTKDKVSSEMMSGGLDMVMNLFSDKPNSSGANSLLNGLTGSITQNLASKLGIDPAKAQMIAAIAMPMLIKLVTSKNNETPENDPSPLNDLFGGLAGAMGGGTQKKSGNSALAGTAFKILGGLFGKK